MNCLRKKVMHSLNDKDPTFLHSDPRRIRLLARPYCTGAAYDFYARPSILHADLYAFVDTLGNLYYCAEYRRGGKDIIAIDWWRVSDNALEAMPAPATYAFMRPMFWNAENAAVMARAHKALMARVRALALPGFARTSVLCHYVKQIRYDPWPRGWVNRWKPHAPKSGRPRKSA